MTNFFTCLDDLVLPPRAVEHALVVVRLAAQGSPQQEDGVPKHHARSQQPGTLHAYGGHLQDGDWSLRNARPGMCGGTFRTEFGPGECKAMRVWGRPLKWTSAPQVLLAMPMVESDWAFRNARPCVVGGGGGQF